MENRGLTRHFLNSTLKLTSLLNESRNFHQKRKEFKTSYNPNPETSGKHCNTSSAAAPLLKSE